MIEIKKKEQCCACYACYSICPTKAIDMIEDDKGFKYPEINKEKCIKCGLCENACPIISNKKVKNVPKAYACVNKDESVRIESSSGGIFSLIAETILNLDGVVFGASFDKNFNVKHIYIEDKKDIEKLRGSKYVQSDIGDTYKKAKEFLENGKYVLFTGTPCQIEGLKKYLGREYDKLYTQDLICHGVPSIKVWRKYLAFRKKQDNENPIKINFRQKNNGWKSFELLLQYNNKKYIQNHSKDSYMKAFLLNLSLRDSCYSCNFKNKNKNSDITLADFWGIEHILPEMNDDKGTSLVIINSDKGRKIFREIEKDCDIKEVDFEESIKYNPAYYKSANVNENREKFFYEINTEKDFKKIVKRFVPRDNIYNKIIRKIKKNIRKN